MEEEAALSRAQIEMTIRDRRDEGKFIIGLLACHTFFTGSGFPVFFLHYSDFCLFCRNIALALQSRITKWVVLLIRCHCGQFDDKQLHELSQINY